MLTRWFNVRERRDVVIKQNTGGGKTAAGLLIAQSSINDGVGPAPFLAPDTYLVAQVRAEAGKLGIAVTDDPRSAAFASSRAILVTTLQKLINGKGVFGVAGARTPADRAADQPDRPGRVPLGWSVPIARLRRAP